MSAGTLYDVGAPTLEVRIYDHDRLLGRELCESEADAAAVVDRWSDLANLFVVADDHSTSEEAGDVLELEEPLFDDEEDYLIASASSPAYGTE